MPDYIPIPQGGEKTEKNYFVTNRFNDYKGFGGLMRLEMISTTRVSFKTTVKPGEMCQICVGKQ